MIRGPMDPVHESGSMDPVHILMDPVHEGGPWTRGPYFVLSPFNYYVVNAVWHSLFRIPEVQTPLAIEPAK